MSKDNSRFFEKKKVWSVVKDELLGCYLVPYFNKLFYTRKPILYVDCFAGKGKFDDGSDGSPLVALKCLDRSIQQCLEMKNNAPTPQVLVRLIEKNHASVLEGNIPQEHRHRTRVFDGAFETTIIPLLNASIRAYRDLNVFLYVDPYGIKALNMGLFLQLPGAFSTAELLINLNSFGFIREALRVRKVALRENEEELLRELDEYEPSTLQSVDDLVRIAGGDYWMGIVNGYASGNLDIDDAEKRFAEQYKAKLRASYKYVLDMPMRLHAGNKPKYRMIYATNHPDGCILMADNIFKRNEYLYIDIQHRGQLSLFESAPDNGFVDESDIDSKFLALLEQHQGMISLNTFQAAFFGEYGVICSTKHLSSGQNGSSLKRLEKQGMVLVKRDPPIRNGKPTRFYSEGKNQSVWIRKA